MGAGRLALGPYGPGAVLLLGALAAVCEAAVLLQRTDEWQTSFVGAVLWQATSAQFLAPLVAGATAVVASSVRSSALGTLARVARRDGAVLRRLTVQAAIVALAVHAAGLAAAIAVAHAYGLRGTPSFSAALPASVAIVAWAAVGAAVGWRLHSKAAAPLAVVIAGLATVPIAYALPTATAELAGGPDGVGFVARPAWVVAGVAFSVMVATIALSSVSRRWRRSTTRAVTVAATAAILVLVVTGPTDLVKEDHGPLACRGSAPAVCVFPERIGFAAGTARSLHSMTAAFDGLVPGALSGIRRWSEGWEPASRTSASLTIADPDARDLLTQDVVAAAGRCGSTAVDGVLQLWIDRHAGGRPSLRPEEVGLVVPPGYLTPERFDRAMRVAVRGLGGRCPR